MSELLKHITTVLVPLIITNIGHMLVVKKNYFTILNQPISQQLFGKNKTWRGFLFVPFINATILLFINSIVSLELSHPILLGLVLGLAYVLAELPNSLLKRSLGIQAGEQHKRYKLPFALLDKTDSAFGVAMVYYALGFVTFRISLFLFIINSLTHIIFSQFLVLIKIKSSF